jgi:RNA polymerase sigma-70 factor (ECF subfamily)
MTSLHVTLAAGTLQAVKRRTEIHRTWQHCCQSFGRYFAVRTRGDLHLVDDLMQQLWVRAAGRAENCRDDDPEPWMWRIAQNLLREHRRREGGCLDRRMAVDPGLARELAARLDREALPDELLAREEVRQQITLALTSLTAADQELLIGFYFEERSQAELARRLELSERAIEGRLYRARRALRDRLERIESTENEP